MNELFGEKYAPCLGDDDRRSSQMLPKKTSQLSLAYSKTVRQSLYTYVVTVKSALIDKGQSSGYCIRCAMP
jgi:hypothetical protein